MSGFLSKVKTKRGCLQMFTGIFILGILVFMVIALVQFQTSEEADSFQEQYGICYDEGWTLAYLADEEVSETEMPGHDVLKDLFQEAKKQGACKNIKLPYEREGTSGVLVMQNTLPAEYAGMTLTFRSSASMMRIVLDDEMIFQNSIFDADYENYVNIPNEFQTGEIWIELAFMQPDVAQSFSSLRVENHDLVVIGIVGNNISDIVCCLLMAIMSVIMFVMALIRASTRQAARGEPFMGLVGVVAGVYCFIATDTLNLFYNLPEAYEIQVHLAMLMPIFLSLYLEQRLRAVYPRRFFVLTGCVCAQALVQIVLHVFGIRHLEEMWNLSATVTAVVCGAAVASMLQYRRMDKRRIRRLPILAMVILLAGVVANILMNVVLKITHVNGAGQYSLAVFSILMTFDHVLELAKEYRSDAEMRVAAAEEQNMRLAQAMEDADAARNEAQRANEAKGKFLAHMSHEIRTPINAVLGMDEMILRESKEPDIKAYAMDIYTAAKTLLSLINDILDFSKIESGKMEIVPVAYDVSSLVHDLANMAYQRAGEKSIRLEIEVEPDIPSRLYGDDVRLRQVLANILTNAVKYTQEGTVWLRVQNCGTFDDMARLRYEIEDTGIGIKEEDLPKLFAEFERIEENRNRNIEGTGLGMSITIQLLALLGSRLQVESIYGEGSKFYFELDQKVVDSAPVGEFADRVRKAAETYRYEAKFCAPQAKVLVVDDNAINRKVLRGLLKETRVQVTDAPGGAECLELVQKGRFDLIFLDHMMPGMDGIETLHRMKAMDVCPCRDTPVVALTANAVSGAKEMYLSEGFDDFLSKPVDPEKLERMLHDKLPERLLQKQPEPEKPAGRLIGGETGETDLPPSSGKPEKPASRLIGGETGETDLPPVDGLDWRYAKLHLPDRELLEYTLKEFYGQLDDAADVLYQLYSQITEPQQLEAYRIQVHAMKSLAATVGILPLSGVAKLLESAARDGRLDIVQAMTNPFLEEWRSYRQKLQGVFGIGAQPKKEMADAAILQALVEMVRISIQEMDIDQADEQMERLLEYQYPQEMDSNIRQLKQAVTNLDPQEASQAAGLLIGQLQQYASQP